jgi:hypothetical protein
MPSLERAQKYAILLLPPQNPAAEALGAEAVRELLRTIDIDREVETLRAELIATEASLTPSEETNV